MDYGSDAAGEAAGTSVHGVHGGLVDQYSDVLDGDEGEVAELYSQVVGIPVVL
jgi:hypothetical protein